MIFSPVHRAFISMQEQEGYAVKIHRIDHVGIIVNDLAAARAFFLDFGLELQGEGELEGEWLDKIVGLKDVKDAYAFLRTPDGEANIELIQFYRPLAETDIQPPLANTPGIRHIAFVVEDIEAVVARLKKKGTEIVGRIQNIDTYKLCYIRGPEGIILELAEPVK
jgi:catechol 2,3-dioxygenase-like lactoylglutathione lyase family enzyme